MKRRVIAIVVVLAAVGVVWQWEPVWRAVMMKKVTQSLGLYSMELKWVPRWGEDQEPQDGPRWWLHAHGTIQYVEYENGAVKRGSVTTRWDSDGKIREQFRWIEPRDLRTSPPWWPHPPLIDLREFEE